MTSSQLMECCFVFLGQLTEVDMVERNSKESWKAEVKLNEHAVKFKVDTGPVTVIPPNI